jgi:hypothetical protein
MVKDKKISLKNLFNNLQTEMIASLGVLTLDHGPTKGDATELDWLNMFQKYLPKRYVAEKAFVIDCKGLISDAIDIVIFDNHFSPFLLNKNGVKLVPAESVYAVFEVKQEINAKNVRYAGLKAQSVRRLHRTSTTINNAGQIQKAKEHSDILAGILATKSAWKNSRKNLEKALENQKGNRKLNMGCCLGAFFFEYSTGSLLISDKSDSLVKFFLGILHKLQSIGTVPAMDITAYIE